MSALLLGLVLLPFGSAALSLLVGHRAEVAVKGLSVGASGLGLVLAGVVAVPQLGDAAATGQVYASTSAAGPPIELSMYVDQLSAVMLLLAHTVSFLVQVYSLGYLAADPRYPSYTALVALFTGAMTVVVTADDLWLLLVGWELMGACSYFLIAHHWELPEAREGAVKAFLMTRTADLGLLFAIILLGIRFDSYRISTIMAAISDGGFVRDELWLPAMLLGAAVIGKSAQFPLHTWLPDAMPGPTPISALIHAATMVAAGVFLVARTYPLFLSAPAALNLLAGVAALTMLLGALYALLSEDLKRVLAWSTVSQLAYMFGALAVGAYSAGILHLLAHGAFKALLFLAAGSVVHAVGSTSMSSMGGLREKLPDTFITMTVGFGALAGIAPLVGFFTKDAVIGASLDAATAGRLIWPWLAWVLFASTVLTALVTVAYCLRAWLRVFFGQVASSAEPAPTSEPAPPAEPVDEDQQPPVLVTEVHESPWAMRGPLYLLAVPTTVGGLAVAYPHLLLGSEREHHLLHPELAVVMTLLIASAAAVTIWAGRRSTGRATRRPFVPHPPVDRIYEVGLVRPVRRLALLVRAGDRDVIDAYAVGAGASARGLGWVLRLSQNGNVQGYLMVVVVGAAALAVAAGVMA
ncbi:MAG: NADH-ubiquinone oxidoreductase chain L [uncultured Nocardioidaceae bacterium]|uniref:NADH-ubiquinone oxidoreductase chain L n=1 Tax=uncultured Nocardioidaceae bacterium TaxID=253824 RepID=A0A6J4LIK0_9ACTN|nr:MAG: NADH-ubiquinone oxidoreductase chain L [uncultured Nocardioidaceae bacterium]